MYSKNSTSNLHGNLEIVEQKTKNRKRIQVIFSSFQ